MATTSTQPLPRQIKPADLHRFHRALQRWYGIHGRRDLPWRNTNDPYAIWLSEVMLQQTQVKTVLERYYQPFLTRFPTITALAHAPRDALMKAWEGLGYYNRANNLHRAAQKLAAANAQLPETLESLLNLPGIGKNTAHAILAFAFHKPVAVMEANLKRVLCRIFALASPSEHELFALAHAMVDKENPFDYNQAMMDIGAMVCTRRSPHCASCPASFLCMGKTSPEDYPAPKTKKQTPVRERIIVAWQHKGGYYLEQRQSRFLHGLYGFAEYEDAPPHLTFIGEAEHTYSHFHLKARVAVGDDMAIRNTGAYYTLCAIENLPISRADTKVLKLLQAYEARLPKTPRRKK